MISARSFVLVALASSASVALVFAAQGCGPDAADVEPGPTSDAPSGKEGSANEDGGDPGSDRDAATDAPPTPDAEAGVEAGSCSKGKVRPATGETCVGYGKGTPCNTECGEYGYVCFENGGPPGFAGCLLINDNGQFGQTYCCTENKCVAQPDQDGMCTTAGKTHRYQCPPNGSGGTVAPPAGCADGGSGATALERFYCCP